MVCCIATKTGLSCTMFLTVVFYKKSVEIFLVVIKIIVGRKYTFFLNIFL